MDLGIGVADKEGHGTETLGSGDSGGVAIVRRTRWNGRQESSNVAAEFRVVETGGSEIKG